MKSHRLTVYSDSISAVNINWGGSKTGKVVILIYQGMFSTELNRELQPTE